MRVKLSCTVPAQCKRLEGGLDKLKEASEQLAELNTKLAEQKVVLADKSSACEILLQEISTNTTVGQCKLSRLISILPGLEHAIALAVIE